LADEEVVRGTLAAGALAPRLGRLQRACASGWLRLSGVQLRSGIPSVIRVGIRLRGGRVVAAEVPDDPLRPLPPGADLAERATAGLARILACGDAVEGWEPLMETGAADPAAPLLAAVAVRAIDRLDEAAVRAALGDTSRHLLAVGTEESASAMRAAISDRALLAGISPGVTAADLLRAQGEAGERALLAVLGAGLAEWAPEPPSLPAPPPAVKPASTSAPSPASRPITATSQAFREVQAATAPRPTPTSVAARQEIEAAHAALRGATHFGVLGLGVSASDEEIRQAFARLARRYHPDAQTEPGLADLGPKLTDLFVAASKAYAVLKDPAARDRYERAMSLRMVSPRPPPARRTRSRPACFARRRR